MNCPYCDEGIHPLAKFCPKCGLPIKDDATVMGWVPDEGPNPFVIGLGALGIVAVALSIGWFSTRGRSEARESVRREPVLRAGMPTVTPVSNWGATWGAPPVTSSPGSTWSFQTPYIVRPRSEMPKRLPRPEPQAPPVPLLAINLYRPRPRPQVLVMRETVPAPVPASYAPYYPLAGAAYGGAGFAPSPRADGSLPSQPESSSLSPAGPSPAASGSVEVGESAWTWDPIQERWARRPDPRDRRAGGNNVVRRF